MMRRATILPGVAALAIVAAISAGVLATAASFTEPFTGAPAKPTPLQSENWEVAFVSSYGDSLTAWSEATEADHGPNCEAPGDNGSVTHTVKTFAESVFQCRDHIMTTVPAGSPSGYGAIYLTPNQMADFSNGPVTISFDVSTLSNSNRDWIDLWVQPWDTQEQRILDDEMVTPQSNPRNAVHVEMGGAQTFISGDQNGRFHVEVFDANRNRAVAFAPTGASWESVLTPSAQTRSTVQVVLSRTHIKVWMPQYNLVWVDRDIPTIPFTQGVVSFGHHSYSAFKGDDPTIPGFNLNEGKNNTFHWDNISISPSVPFTIIGTDSPGALWDDTAAKRTVTFKQPAPANAFLRFGAVGEAASVSFDGGPFQSAPRTGTLEKLEHHSSYLIPVPQGATRATFQVTPAWGFLGQFDNPWLFARTAPVVTPSPTATAIPTATATASATATPKVTSTATATATATSTVPPTATASPPAGGGSGMQCEAQFRYRDEGTGVYREVWRTVDCATGELLTPVR